jgi:hypothetical protein
VPRADADTVTTTTAESGLAGKLGHALGAVAGPLELALGSARMAVGVGYLAFPVSATRMLGVDGATAARMAWLARMTAARDLALGAGAVSAAITNGRTSAWTAAGMLSDAIDAAVITVAARQRRLNRLRASAAVAAAAAGAVGGAVALALPVIEAIRDRG